MNITEFSVKYPNVILVVLGLLIIFGISSVFQLPVQLLPDIERPEINIYTGWRSAAPQEVEEAIIQPQEELLRFNEGLETVFSQSNRGGGSINLVYQAGFDMKQAMMDVISRLNQLRQLPDDASEPFVSAGGGGLPGAGTVLVYASKENPVKDMDKYHKIVRDVIEPQLSRIDGVARVNINLRRPEISIVLDPYKAAMYGIQLTDISRVLTRSRDVSGGYADIGNRRYTVRFMGEEKITRLGQLIIGWRNQIPIRLDEVSTIETGLQEKENIILRNGLPAIYITIDRRNDANTVKLLDDLNKTLNSLNEGPLRKAGLIIELSFDASLHIRRAISMVNGNLLLGLFLATVVLFYFLRNVRSILLIAMMVPACLLVSFICLALLGISLNVISLAGLAFSVGLIMDASIIVQENILRLIQSGCTKKTAVIEGVGQVKGALFASTATTVAIFLPVLFMSGVEGQLFSDLAVTITVSVCSSFVVAITLLPVATYFLDSKVDENDRLWKIWEGISERIIRFTDSKHVRLLFISGITIGSIVISLMLVPKLDLLPRAKVDSILVFFNTPSGMNLNTIESRLGKEVVDRLAPYMNGAKSPEIKSYNFASFNGTYSQVVVYPKNASETSVLIEKLRSEILADLPDTSLYISQGSMIRFGGGGGREINVDIQGADIERLMKGAEKGQQVISGIWPGTNVNISGGSSLNEPELRIFPDDVRIRNSGMDRSSVADMVRAFTDGLYVGEYFDGNERMNMFIRGPSWDSPEDLLSIPVNTSQAGIQKIGDLVTIKRQAGPGNLSRVNGRRTVSLNVLPPEEITIEEALEDLEEHATEAIRSELNNEDGVYYRGSADSLKEALSEMSANLLMAITILAMILTAMFKSARDSLIILMIMPSAAAGGLMALWFLNLFVYQSLDILTLIGFVILMGLVVNNAILLVDQTRKAVEEGVDLRGAVLRSLEFRVRPICMSTMTSFFGMLPLAVIPGTGSEIYRGLATVISGGMLVSFFVTFVLLPAMLRSWFSEPIQEENKKFKQVEAAY